MLYGVIPILEHGRRKRRPRDEVWGDLLVEMHHTSKVRTARLRAHSTHDLNSLLPALHYVRLRRMDERFIVLVGREGAIEGPRQAWSCRSINGLEYHSRNVRDGADPSHLYVQFEHWWEDVLRVHVGTRVPVEQLRKWLNLPDDVFLQFLEWATLSYRAHEGGPTGTLAVHIFTAERRLEQIAIKRRFGYGEGKEPHSVEFTDLR